MFCHCFEKNCTLHCNVIYFQFIYFLLSNFMFGILSQPHLSDLTFLYFSSVSSHLLCYVCIFMLINSQKDKMMSWAKAKGHDSQLVTDGIYRKLMLESHKKLEPKTDIDIAPHICFVFMCIAIFYAVSWH